MLFFKIQSQLMINYFSWLRLFLLNRFLWDTFRMIGTIRSFYYYFKSITIIIQMSYQNESFGMMDEGYFVPRGQILGWINSLLKINLTKIEQLGSGSVYCQILDVIYPNKVALNKVNWKAKLEYEFINNLKILQSAFDKLGIKKHLDIQKIVKAKYQDNLELIQWFKRYYDLNCGERGNNYPAEERRGQVVPDFSFADKTVIPKVYNAGGGLQTQTKEIKPLKKQSQTTIHIQNTTTKHEPKPVNLLTPNNQVQHKTEGVVIPRKSKESEKLEMIADIIRNSEETNEEKIKLIEEVLSIEL